MGLTSLGVFEPHILVVPHTSFGGRRLDDD